VYRSRSMPSRKETSNKLVEAIGDGDPPPDDEVIYSGWSLAFGEMMEEMDALQHRHQREMRNLLGTSGRRMLQDRLRASSWRQTNNMDEHPEGDDRKHTPRIVDTIQVTKFPSSNCSLDGTDCVQRQSTFTDGSAEQSGSMRSKLSRKAWEANRTLLSVIQKTSIQPGNAEECVMENSRTDLLRRQTKLQRITRSMYYEWCSGFLVCLNAIFIGYQTEMLAQVVDGSDDGAPVNVNEDALFIIWGSVFFTFMFSIELGLRWISEGFLRFFYGSDLSWRLFDTFIVAISLLDSFWSITRAVSVHESAKSQLLNSVSGLRVLRIVRIVKLAKIIRLISFFRELRIMIYSIAGSMKSLLWVTVILGMCFYIFGITFTLGTVEHVGHNHETWAEPSTVALRDDFGTLGRSCLSLYMAMAGGRSWGEYYKVMKTLPWQYPALFLVFMTFAICAVLNIVTAVFVDSAFQASHQIRQVIIHEELIQKREHLSALRDLFTEMDSSGDGLLTIDEFEDRLCDERVIAFFKAMKLDVTDSRALFSLLDKDNSSQVDIVEFLEGCYQLQGESQSIDTKILRIQVTCLVDKMKSLEEMQQTLLGHSR